MTAKMKSVTHKHKVLVTLLLLALLLVTGCGINSVNNVPPNFLFIMDVKSVGDFEGCVNVNIRIDAEGRGRYDVPR